MPLTLAGLALLALLAWLVAESLRRLGVPGAAIVGGAIAGVLLGPTLFGRIAPQSYEDLMHGGRAEREAMVTLERERAAWQFARASLGNAPEPAGADGESIAFELDARVQAIAAAEKTWRDAVWQGQRPQRLATLALAAAAMVLVGARFPRSPKRCSSHVLGNGVTIGFATIALPCILGLVALWAWEFELGGAISLALLAAISVGARRLNPLQRRAASDVEPDGSDLLAVATSVATIVSGLIIAAALWSAGGSGIRSGTSERLLLGATFGLMLIVSPFAGAHPSRRDARRESASTQPGGTETSVMTRCVLASLAALAVVPIELLLDASLWPLLLLPLLSHDGRWLGAVLGGHAAGRRAPLATMRLMLPASACGATQFAVIAVMMSLGLLPNALALALVLGSLLAEVATPLRRRTDRLLRELEREPGEG